MDNVVGPYRILRLINEGGQGSVYLGYDKRLHRRVAIKIYRLPATRAARKQLLREAQIVASIQSPKVVQIHDVIESGTHLAMVMEYVSGCSLEDFLTAVRPSLASVLTVGADVAGALALARQNHIVHGDVKAGNVLIGENGRAKLTDFGISRTTSEGPASRWAAGSLSAVSPEQFLGNTLDERADLFALGALLSRMLCGEQPFFRDGTLDPDLLTKRPPKPLIEIVTGDVELPDPLVNIIDVLLEKDPKNRPKNTRRVRQVLRKVLLSLPLSANNSLLREARPCFRPESPQDIPPLIPKDLGQQGRSALMPSGTAWVRFKHRLKSLRWPARTALALVLVGLLVVPPTMTMRNTVTPVQFAKPRTSTLGDISLPRGVSRDWLVLEVRNALAMQLGNIRIIGPVGAFPVTVIYSRGEPENWNEAPDMVVAMALRCVDSLCVFTVTREQSGARFSRQGVLLANMSLQEWRDIVHNTTLALYR
ncbi:Serine/threonine-protein kinase PrkC [Halioglobus japonicus]|nr:Serine/threonine-protein kinase PrkC [Halioglobus japonicus]